MPARRLSPLQRRILAVLASADLGWVLTGGGALVGFHLGHRLTRDLDLFWRDRRELAELPREVATMLTAAGFTVDTLQTGLSFCRLRVSDAGEACVVDLVAEPVPAIEPPTERLVGDVAIRVDTVREILANKLCALLSRSEIRDLIDVRGLLDRGLDLGVALDDAARKDGGFSPLTLAWVLRQLDIRVMAIAAGLSAREVEELSAFRDDLVVRVLQTVRDDLRD